MVCLQRTELVAIDENEAAAVESDGPPPRGADDPVCADVDGVAGGVPEILDDHAALLFGGPREDDYRGVAFSLVYWTFELYFAVTYGSVGYASVGIGEGVSRWQSPTYRHLLT